MQTRDYITLSELAGRIRSVLTDAFAFRAYWVVADVTDHKFYPAKNTHYFSLAEKSALTHTLAAKMPAVAWPDSGAAAIASFQRATGQAFRSDIRVLVRVSVSFHKQYGLQLVLSDIDASYTIGQLEAQRQQVLERLLRECPGHVRRAGDRYLTTNSLLELPRVVQKIAVVTSASAAGYLDFRTTLEDNRHGYQVHLDPYFTTMQGEANADGLCRTLDAIRASGTAYDAVVIIRGGGAQTDLLLFNHYDVAATVAAFPIPVISGIGHQINETITDLMAHTPVKTPSIAAETILSRNRVFEDELKDMMQTIAIRSRQTVAFAQRQLAATSSLLAATAGRQLHTGKDRLQRLAARLTSGPLVTVHKKTVELEDVRRRTTLGGRRYLATLGSHLAHCRSLVRLMSPENILKKGFALVLQEDAILTDPSGLQPGQDITIRMSGASIGAKIETISNDHTNEHDL